MNNIYTEEFSREKMSKLIIFCKMLGDQTRLKLMLSLLEGEKCVGHLASDLEMTSSAISHQLKDLRHAGMVKARRDGKQVFYSHKNQRIRDQLIHMSKQML